jgi:deoxyribose-phosphate aldolase
MKINGTEITREWLASKLEYAPTSSAQREVVDKFLNILFQYKFSAITLPAPEILEYVAERLTGTGIRLCTVFDHPVGLNSLKTREIIAKEAYAAGARGADVMPGITAVNNRDWKAVTESIKVIVDAVGPDFETKVFVDCNGDSDVMYAMADCIQEAGATHLKAYDSKGMGVPISRIADLRRRLTNAKLKASGNGKHWTSAVVLGVLAAGADCVSGSNMPQVIDEFPYFEKIYKNITF